MERWLGWCCPSGLTPPPHLSLPKGVRRRECLGHSQTDSSSGAGSSSLPFSLASRHLRRGYGMQRLPFPPVQASTFFVEERGQSSQIYSSWVQFDRSKVMTHATPFQINMHRLQLTEMSATHMWTHAVVFSLRCNAFFLSFLYPTPKFGGEKLKSEILKAGNHTRSILAHNNTPPQRSEQASSSSAAAIEGNRVRSRMWGLPCLTTQSTI